MEDLLIAVLLLFTSLPGGPSLAENRKTGSDSTPHEEVRPCAVHVRFELPTDSPQSGEVGGGN
jgi:hypothetical protein